MPADIDKMVLHKLRQAEEVFENYDTEIAEGNYDYQNLLVFNKETPNATNKAQHELECVELFIKEYFNDIKEDTRTHNSIVKMIGRIDKEDIPIIADNQYINDSFQSFISISRRKESIEVKAFTKDELKKIFDPTTYPRVMDRKYAYRYWIPLLALFHPVRLNELCQLYIEDVRLDKGVWYFRLTDERKDQHLKNPQSRRIIPIHPKIIELGFLEYINSIREASNKAEEYPGRIFYQLHYSAKNHYIQAVSQWFGRYLKQVGIDDRSKVFHSYRHNAKQSMRDADIPQEYQNALAGWSGKDVGERVYGGNFPIKKLNTQLSKLKYPFLNRNIERIAAKNRIKRS